MHRHELDIKASARYNEHNMAQKRMIDKKISVSEQVSNLSIPAQLLYTWGMPHADDIGLLHYSPRTLKATLVPMWDITLDDFTKLTNEIIKQKLWEVYEYKDQKFYKILNFTRYQTLKRDRQPQTILNVDYSKDAKDTWKNLENIGFQLENIVHQMESEGKGSEVNRREVKRSEYTPLFEEFWKLYPKKVGKPKSMELWSNLSKDDMQKAIADIPKRKADRKWIGGFIKDPERYIKNKQWEDDIIEDKPKVEEIKKTHKI